MLAKPTQKFMDAPFRAPSKEGINVISVMPSYRIVWFLVKRHKVGLLAFLAFVGFTYDSLLPFAARELFQILFR